MSPHLKGLLLSAAGMLVISPDGMLVKLVAEAEPLQVVFWRSLFLGLVLLAVVGFWQRRNTGRHLKAIGWGGLLASVLMGVTNIAFVVAMTLTTVSNALVVIATIPMVSALFGLALIGERVRLRTWIAMTLSFTGVVIIMSGSVGLGGGTVIGDLVALSVPVCLGLALVLMRKAGDRDTLPVVALGGILSAAAVLPFCAPLDVTLHDFGIIAIMGLIVSPLALALYTSGARYIPAAEVALLALIETALGPFWAWVGVGEVPPGMTLVGGVLVIGAIAGNSALALLRRGSRSGT
ncbi:DMT family transporter [Roseospira marina]|uniref:DMT family transporter n=1 Tax=Roseospira marina TaxID=140057 RepID=A0A5M6IID4_9PROT|nr:DMT family transporter [Roseospira marina]KAA5607445.1 DMT family transporter [Roseospira marina]MBB4312375.1 drug/metabolite transporter (DMT)-like permease [Roseospira marina]MBB5085609.1 drug/metabolite transporter (DMT)-like permease [Roseospira marina]